MCRVSVVIPNYNGKIYLKDCMEALKGQTFQDFELIFVDNGSTDDSLEYLKVCYPETRVVQLSENYGFCRAVNDCEAKPGIFGFLNILCKIHGIFVF